MASSRQKQEMRLSKTQSGPSILFRNQCLEKAAKPIGPTVGRVAVPVTLAW